MMMLRAYSVFDNAVGAFMTPFFCRTDSEAVRSFTDAVNDPKHSFNRHSVDYVLYAVGAFDDTSARLTEAVDKIVTAAQVLTPEGGPPAGR